MSPAGSDSNNGVSELTAWASPNHPIHCGDVINAAGGTYRELTAFGIVSCSDSVGVAWLKCVIFDACKVHVSTGGEYAAGIQIGRSNWGVQGWEVSTVSSAGPCFFAYPASATTTIHHIVFANDIANGCGQGGFEASPNGSAGVDYFAVIGSIAYNSAQGSSRCTSGINIFEPVAADNAPGTHIYFAGNFAFDNVEPNPCAGSTPTDGQGLFFDTTEPYSQQMVIDNNIAIFNGGSGIKSFANSNGSPNATIYIRQNTTYGNETGSVNGAICAEIALQKSHSSEVSMNLSQANISNQCAGKVSPHPFGADSNMGVSIKRNFGYSPADDKVANPAPRFSADNSFGDPRFANPAKPGPPACGSASSVPKCMSAVIANFTPTVPAALGFGYRVPNDEQVYDLLFPKWLCKVNLPLGLVTMGCLATSSDSESPSH